MTFNSNEIKTFFNENRAVSILTLLIALTAIVIITLFIAFSCKSKKKSVSTSTEKEEIIKSDDAHKSEKKDDDIKLDELDKQERKSSKEEILEFTNHDQSLKFINDQLLKDTEIKILSIEFNEKENQFDFNIQDNRNKESILNIYEESRSLSLTVDADNSRQVDKADLSNTNKELKNKISQNIAKNNNLSEEQKGQMSKILSEIICEKSISIDDMKTLNNFLKTEVNTSPMVDPESIKPIGKKQSLGVTD